MVLTEEIAAECKPKVGKRRRACKDCTCGLKEQIEAEDAAVRSAADEALAAAKAKTAAGVKLTADDLAEIDFTVEGKASSCGNCYLGDAFRYAFNLSTTTSREERGGVNENSTDGILQMFRMPLHWTTGFQAR